MRVSELDAVYAQKLFYYLMNKNEKSYDHLLSMLSGHLVCLLAAVLSFESVIYVL